MDLGLTDLVFKWSHFVRVYCNGEGLRQTAKLQGSCINFKFNTFYSVGEFLRQLDLAKRAALAAVRSPPWTNHTNADIVSC